MTLHQPWASLTAEGIKWIETRGRAHPWSSAVGDTIAIHAAVRTPTEAKMGRYQVWNESGYVWWLDGREGNPHLDDVIALRFGAVLATARLTAVVPIMPDDDRRRRLDPCVFTGALIEGMSRHELIWTHPADCEGVPGIANTVVEDQRPYGDFTPGRFALLFDDVVKLEEPVPARGYQGLWTWDEVGA